MSAEVQTWRYGWHGAENYTAGSEIAYYQRLIEHYVGPVLDADCGTGSFYFAGK